MILRQLKLGFNEYPTVYVGILVYSNKMAPANSPSLVVGTGVDVAMIPVVLDDVDASTPVLNAVANDGVLLPEAVDAEVEVLSSPAVLENVVFA